ncbi:DUF1573 domain-containing protein [Mangrovibacterium lignilyticum]|uniref:DUF1573 domain-containing protein n=1 Tax=Mangrovibacterium lignilyticum TaxID=2668052 RepID=UPI0013D0B6FB|nr:DUF1573 domain-containing protein [Mangrovibacterium lignilyticum]
MRPIAFILFLMGLLSCNSAKKSNNSAVEAKGNPKFAIQEEIHNFGTVQAGELVSYSFKFTNKGDGDLIIDSVDVECGCLKITFPQEPVPAGDYNFIEVLFNSSGEVGNVVKQIQVFSNAGKEAEKLMITARVNNELINIYN